MMEEGVASATPSLRACGGPGGGMVDGSQWPMGVGPDGPRKGFVEEYN